MTRPRTIDILACAGSALCVTIVLLLAALPGHAQTAAKPLFQIVTDKLPLPEEGRGRPYFVQLQAVGGKGPYHWSLESRLPTGLVFDAARAVISGRTYFGQDPSLREFSVTVQVSDSSQPPLVVSKLLVAASTAPLTIEWSAAPSVVQSNISGAVRVTNGSRDAVDMTIIVVAVNEIGKAFALRYEKLNLPPGNQSPDLKFDVFVPSGHYSVHADAAAEVAAKKAIYRDRREVDGLAVQ